MTKTLPQLAADAAQLLRRQGYTVIDVSHHGENAGDHVETGLWQVQFFNSPPEKLTHEQIVKKARRK